MTNITYRQAKIDTDSEFCKALHHSAYRDVVIRQFGTWIDASQDQFFLETWETKPHKIILWQNQPIGVISATLHSDHLFLHELQIAPEYQGRGFGTMALTELLEEAKRLGLALRLQVLKENRALKLYQRIGFKPVGSTDSHIKMEWTPCIPTPE